LKATPRIRSESCETRKGRKRTGDQLRAVPNAHSTTARCASTHLHSSSGHLLGSNEVLVKIVLVEAKDGVDDHGREEGLLRVDELRGHGGGGEEVEMLFEDSVGREKTEGGSASRLSFGMGKEEGENELGVGLVDGNSDLLDLLDGLGCDRRSEMKEERVVSPTVGRQGREEREGARRVSFVR
jgi:hypothetical protein